MNKKRRTRISEYIITLLVVITLNFLLPRAMPGDPFLFLSSEQDETVLYSAEQRQHYLEYYGLNKPILQQYFVYLGKIIKGDMGDSLYYNEKVISIILRRLLWTFFLVIAAVLLSTIFGVLLGSVSSWYRDGPIDKFLFFNIIVFSEIPSFLIGLVLLFVLAAGLNLFPLSGAISHFQNFNNAWEKILDILYHAILPVISLAIARFGGSYLLSRNSITSVLNKDYIRTARAKGLSKGRISITYVIRNALLPIVTRVFLSLGSLVGGAIMVENVFAYPGLGSLMRESVMVRDYPLIQGIFLVVSIFVLTSNFLADLVYKIIDPRISYKINYSKGE